MFQRRFMQGGIGGLGGGLDSAFNPLKQMLANSIAQEQVEPFVEEVKQMAQERFDLGNGTSGGGQFTGDRPQMGFNQVGDPSAGQTAFRGNQDMRAEILAGFGGGSLNSTQPFAGLPTPEGALNMRDVGNAFFKSAFGRKDGGEVMNSPMSAGLGSFLASNIDEFGRNGDTEMIHATREEVIMPKGMMEDPQIRETIRQAFERTGRDMAEYTVGSGQMNVNPFTGYEEAFDLIKGIKNIFKKAAPILLPAAVSFLFPGMAPVVSGAIAGGVGSLLQGGDFKDALKGAALGGLSSSLTSYATRGNFGFQGDPNYKTFEMRRFGEGSAPDLSGKLSAAADKTKGFFTKAGTEGVTAAQAAKEVLKIPGMTVDNPNFASLVQNATVAGTPSSINLGRAIPAGLGIMAVTGAFDPIEEDPLEDPYENTSRELLEMYPERYTTGPILPPIRTNLDDVMQRRRNRDIVLYAAEGGEMFPRKTGAIAGPGTGTSDDIPAMLSDGEFVMTAKAVRGAGNGSRKKGVKKMYDMMRAFEGGAVA